MREIPDPSPTQPDTGPITQPEVEPAVIPQPTSGPAAAAEYRPGQNELPSVPWGAEPSRAHRQLPKVPWNGRDMVWSVILGFGLLMALEVVFTILLAVIREITGIELSAASGVVAIVAELVLLLPVWWFGIRKYRVSWSAVGLRDFAIARGLGLGCISLLFAFAFNMLWGLFLYFSGLTGQTNLLPLFGNGFGGLLLALFTGGVVAPIAEEVFFRGFLFAGLYRRKGLWPAVVLSAMLFALVHITPTSWPPIFLLGVIFALLYEWTGSIWPAVVAHGAVNSLSFLALYLLQLVGTLER